MNIDERKKRITKQFERIMSDDSRLDDLEFVLTNLFSSSTSLISKKQYAELEETIQQVNDGEMKMMSLEEAKAELKKRYGV